MSEREEAGKAPDVVLFKSDIEAAGARVAERALNDTWTGVGGFFGESGCPSQEQAKSW